MKTVKEILLPAVILFAICLVATTLLALTNQVTAPVIEKLESKTAAEARAKVLPGADSFDAGHTITYNGTEYIYYKGFYKDGELAGFTFTTSAGGYGGDVVIMTGVGADGAVTGVSALSQSETPGLGAKAAGNGFLGRFVGKSGIIALSKAGKAAENGVDAVTGATISSKAVTEAINLALVLYTEVPENG
ncbi:MAG: RnfABCDGE type electron transport complex subunit G [Oscillospiraceae bacterium]|nr:RnfABCDGE type electron transport complex subunit G [Oscillospiraceae bacterium]